MKYKRFCLLGLISFILILNLSCNVNKGYNSITFEQPAFADAIKDKKEIKPVNNNNVNKSKKTNTQLIKQKKPVAKKSFLSMLAKFLPILIGIVILIYIIKLLFKLAFQNKANLNNDNSETIIQEKDPETISEAVSSFVKHRIKY